VGKCYEALQKPLSSPISFIMSKNLLQNFTHTQMFAGSFLFLIFGGTLLLKTLPGLYVHEELSWLDALFTSTSAICVTGLIVADTATYFTFWGQLLILVLIQVGGLGMLTFTSLIIVALGKRLSLREESLYQSFAGDVSKVSPYLLIRKIVLFTFIIETVGAFFLFLFFYNGNDFTNTVWNAIFHSVSAFCNAGFSIFSDSLFSSNTNKGVLLTCSVLIIFGGIGFFTMDELYRSYSFKPKGSKYLLTLQTRIVLYTSMGLLLSGAILYALLEWNGVLGSLSILDRMVNAFFMSTTSRTAGFNSIPYADSSDASSFLTIILMMIGGSPGSTAGGIKTTTVFLIFLLAWSRIKGDKEPVFRARSIPSETINRAVGLLVVASIMVTSAVFLLCITESAGRGGMPFLVILFEVVSAFNTVGLSIGATSDFSSFGKLILIVLMVLGRVGLLTFAAAILLKARANNKFRYAYEDIVVG
jgi:trk system potassium uptake protein